MQLLFFIFFTFAQVLTSNAQCFILPITPTEFNGLAPCGYGSLTAGCVCCPNAYGQTACLNLIQKCVPGLDGGYICVNNPEYTSSCASGGLANCGTGCMPSGATCCSGQNDWCPAGYHCGTTSDCIPDTLSSSSSRSSLAAVFTLSPSTTKATATSPTATVPVLSSATTKITATSATTTVPVLSSATTKITATSATTTVSALSSPTNKNAATSSISASHSQSASSVATRKGYGGISCLVIMVAVNVFIFPWL